MDYGQIVEKIIVSYDFHNKKEYDEYMDEHPKANKSNHKIVELIKKPSKNDKYDKIRKKVEDQTKGKSSGGNINIKVSGSCETVKELLSAMGGSSSVKENEDGSCVGSISLGKEKAEKLISAIRGK